MIPDERWCLYVLADSVVDERHFRIGCMVSDLSRECLQWSTGGLPPRTECGIC